MPRAFLKNVREKKIREELEKKGESWLICELFREVKTSIIHRLNSDWNAGKRVIIIITFKVCFYFNIIKKNIKQ